MLALEFDRRVKKPYYRRKTPLVLGETWTQVLADSMTIAASATMMWWCADKHIEILHNETSMFYRRYFLEELLKTCCSKSMNVVVGKVHQQLKLSWQIYSIFKLWVKVITLQLHGAVFTLLNLLYFCLLLCCTFACCFAALSLVALLYFCFLLCFNFWLLLCSTFN